MAILLAFSSAYRQKVHHSMCDMMHHVMHHLKFAAIHWIFNSTIFYSYYVYTDNSMIIYTGFPRSCNNTVQANLRTRKIANGKFDSPQP